METNKPAGFGDALQRYRLAAGLTQEELAERARLSARAISDLERGAKTRPHIATIRQLADALQLSEEERGRFQRAARERLPATAGGNSLGAPPGKQQLPVGGFLGSLPTSALVARGEEMQRLLGALQAAVEGQGRLVFLAGEPGIGKTRLAQEVTRIAHDRGFLIAAGRCYEPQQSVPHYPFLDALSMAYAAAPPLLREEAPHRWPYLVRLLPDQFSSTTAPSSDSPEEQTRLFRAVAAFLLALAEHDPVVLLLDDLHWSDSASLQLLQHLARQTRGGRVVLIGTYRDVEVYPNHPLEASLLDLNREQLMERMILQRLGERDTSSLIMQTMGRVDAEREFTAMVYHHTNGNPFFTQQVLQALVENGALYQEHGQWKRRAIQEIEVPESVRSVIGHRVSHLRPDAQEVLQEASVLGPAFTFDDLLAMKSPGESLDLEDTVDAALADASSFGLVRLTGKDRYAFDHALTQQALYATLSPHRRRRLHLAAGESMENLPERLRNQRAAELAWHFFQGDDEARAIRYSLLAGDQAESVFAHAEAERHYRSALDLAQETGDAGYALEALEKLGVVLKIVGRYEEARGFLERAAGAYHEDQDLEGQGRVEAQIGLLCQLTGVPEEGIRRLQPLAKRLEQFGPSRSLALLYAALIRLYDHVGRQSAQMDASRKLLELARDLQDERLLAEAELHEGVSMMHLGRYDEALGLLKSAIPRAEHVGDLHTVITALRFCAVAHRGRYEVDQATHYHEQALEVAERLGDPREISHRAVEAAYHTFLVGDWTHSKAYAERAVVSALDLDSLRPFIQPLYTLGELSLYTGAWDDASGYLQECVTIAEHLQLTDHLREVQALLAEKDLLEGDPVRALARIRPLLDTAGWEEHLSFLLLLASIRLETGDLDGAEEVVGKALADTTRNRLPLGLVEALRIQGAIAGRRGVRDEAVTILERAVQLARDITYPWGEARSLYELGLELARSGSPDRAGDALEAASAIFTSLGAEPYRVRTAAARAALKP